MKRKYEIACIVTAALFLAACGNVKKQDNAAAYEASIFVGTSIVREADRAMAQQVSTEGGEAVSDMTNPTTEEPESVSDSTPTPKPTATPASTATPTATPAPTTTPESKPEATATPQATSAPTPQATPAPTPQATSTPTPQATPTPTSTSQAASTPVPQSTPESVPTSTHQHVWTQKEVQPNCFRNGARWEECLECGAVQNEVQLPQTSHVEGEPEVYTEGETTVTTWRCVNCGSVTRESTTRPYDSSIDPPLTDILQGAGGSSAPNIDIQ